MSEQPASAAPSPPLASIPFEFTGNLIYLRLDSEHSRPLTFILETGAGMTALDEDTAAELGLRSTGSLPAAGAGAKTVEVALATLSRLRLGPVTINRLPVTIHSFKHLQGYVGRRFDGLLGVNVLSRYAVEIDYAGQRVHLHDPRTFHHVGPGEALPLKLELNLIHVRARILRSDGVWLDGKFVIDTGAGGASALVLTAPFVREHGLPGAGQPTLALESAGLGIGGAAKGSLGRLEEIRLGGIGLAHPTALFSEDTEGFLSWPGRAGIIGNEILRRFRVVLDYSRKQLVLEGGARANEPFEYDMSGLVIAAEGWDLERLRVARVLPGSPASEAGIQPGDVIQGLDDDSSPALTLSGVRALLRRNACRYRLSIRRGFDVLEIPLETRRLI